MISAIRVNCVSGTALLLVSVLAALLLAAFVLTATDHAYLLTTLSRMVIMAIAAMGLNLILGFGGMPSFGHALFVGIGVYAVFLFDFLGVDNGWLQLATALGTAALVGLLEGSLALRLSGLYFLMFTLAFSQMAFYLFTGLEIFGGDQGAPLAKRSIFLNAISLENPVTFLLVCVAALAVISLFTYRLLGSRFGMVIQGARINVRRMSALGFPVFRYRLVAFTMSAMVCSVAGMLLVNLNDYSNPRYFHWSMSGDLCLINIIGGLRSVAGPIVGAVAYITLQEILALYTEHWQTILGPVLAALVVFGHDGIVGMLGTRRNRGA